MKTFIIILSIVSTLSLTSASLDSNLKYGQKSSQVSELQEFLVDKGFLTTSPSGFFGLMTLKAVKNYQLSIGLPNTGFVGLMTRTAINNELSIDISSSTEAEVQETGTTTLNTGSSIDNTIMDICLNIEGMQTKVPDGMFMNGNGVCFTPITQSQPVVQSQIQSNQVQAVNEVTDIIIQTRHQWKKEEKYGLYVQVFTKLNGVYSRLPSTISGDDMETTVLESDDSDLWFTATGTKNITVTVPKYNYSKSFVVEVQ